MYSIHDQPRDVLKFNQILSVMQTFQVTIPEAVSTYI